MVWTPDLKEAVRWDKMSMQETHFKYTNKKFKN